VFSVRFHQERAAMPDPTTDWERVDSSYVAEEGNDLILFRTRYDSMRNPRNDKVLRRLILESVDWVNMVALDRDGHCIMVRQYRFGVGYSTLETPGGMVDPGEDSLTSAKRELLEETGYGGGRWTYLGAVEPNPAIHNHLCHHWLAEDVEITADPELGDGEAIEIVKMSEGEVRGAVQRGELRHALALSVLSRVFDLWPRPYRHPAPEQ
ncbi:MAG: NUDIX hydrolase, partial [Pseudomonadota bacterium]